MIVKVQLPLYPVDSREALIYDEKRTFELSGEATNGLMKLMAGRKKAFFFATWIEEQKAIKIDDAPWQEW